MLNEQWAVTPDDAAAHLLPSPERIQELLFDAARLGRTDVLPALLIAGADIEGHDPKGYTPLILASYNGREETAALLLAQGARIDAPDTARGNTALIGVAFKGYDALAARLLDAGAMVNRTNKAGQTALMMAAMFNHCSILERLLAFGANPEIADGAGNTAVSLAMAQGNEKILAKLGSKRFT